MLCQQTANFSVFKTDICLLVPPTFGKVGGTKKIFRERSERKKFFVPPTFRIAAPPLVWGRSPQRGPGAEPLVRGAKPPLKLKSFLLLDVRRKRQICPYSPCIADSVNYLNFQSYNDSGDRPGSHLGLRSRLELAPKRLESRRSHHLMTRLEVFVT